MAQKICDRGDDARAEHGLAAAHANRGPFARDAPVIGGDDLARVTEAARTGPKAAILPVIDEIAQCLLGHRLLTVMRLHAATVELERLYSSHAEAYPAGGRKSKRGLPWTEHVLVRGEVFIGTHPPDLEWAFDDHAKLADLGLGSVINTPILFDGRCLGALNLLHEPGRYHPGDDAVTKPLAYLLTPLLLAA
ncbi:GAF domain-containing protein [Bradyrhizobium sp. Rc3b]|uniref:GAF domain-containing protein n=1 Tax=Bradyrhizobium sp. Rc3b TaxID=1855322 RepID=UPI0011608A1F|nr:GAF domain-containing protein [Bradyrhizobium sp. Rc3b]